MMGGKFSKFVQIILGLHALYYIFTGMWALVSIDSFNAVVGHFHEGLPFEMHSIALMSMVLGFAFLYAAYHLKKEKTLVFLALGIALAVIAVEIAYLPRMGWNLFWLDMIEEIIVSAILGFYLFNKPQKS